MGNENVRLRVEHFILSLGAGEGTDVRQRLEQAVRNLKMEKNQTWTA